MAKVGKDLTSRVSEAISAIKVEKGQKCLPHDDKDSLEGDTLCAKTQQHMNELLNECTEQNQLEQDDDQCQEHQWKLNLFCLEPDCETPICVQCLYEGHKHHDFGNVEEVLPEICEVLLTDVQSLKEKLQRNKDKLITVQNKEIARLSSCIATIRKNEEELIRKIKKKTEKIVQTALDHKTQVNNSFNEAIAKIQDNFVLLESIEETTSEYTSHKSLTDKMKAVKKSGEQVEIAMTEVEKYKFVTFEECKVPNRKVKALCGRLKGRRRKIPLLKIKEMNRSTLKQRMLAKRESESKPAEFCEQNRGTKEEASKEVDVVEVSDDDEASKRKTVVKPELRDTPRSKDISERNPSSASKQSADVRPKMPTVVDSHKKNGPAIPDLRFLPIRPNTPNNRSFTIGPNIPDERSLTKWSCISDSRPVTRWGSIPDNRFLTRGPVNNQFSPHGTADQGHYGPTAKRARHDIRALPTTTLKVRYTGGKMILTFFHCFHFLISIICFGFNNSKIQKLHRDKHEFSMACFLKIICTIPLFH